MVVRNGETIVINSEIGFNDDGRYEFKAVTAKVVRVLGECYEECGKATTAIVDGAIEMAFK